MDSITETVVKDAFIPVIVWLSMILVAILAVSFVIIIVAVARLLIIRKKMIQLSTASKEYKTYTIRKKIWIGVLIVLAILWVLLILRLAGVL